MREEERLRGLGGFGEDVREREACRAVRFAGGRLRLLLGRGLGPFAVWSPGLVGFFELGVLVREVVFALVGGRRAGGRHRGTGGGLGVVLLDRPGGCGDVAVAGGEGEQVDGVGEVLVGETLEPDGEVGAGQDDGLLGVGAVQGPGEAGQGCGRVGGDDGASRTGFCREGVEE